MVGGVGGDKPKSETMEGKAEAMIVVSSAWRV